MKRDAKKIEEKRLSEQGVSFEVDGVDITDGI